MKANVLEWINGDRKVKLTDTGKAFVITLHVPHRKVAHMGTTEYTPETKRERYATAMSFAARVR